MFKKHVTLFFLGCSFLAMLVIFNIVPSIGFAATAIAKGADIGWLSQLEDRNVEWQNDNGIQEDPLQILKDHGIDSVRLRVFVNPPADFRWTKNDGSSCLLGYSDKNGVVSMAQRAKAMGLKVMIDFHYSDHFADPDYQDKPSAWVNHDFNQLQSDVYDHTYDVMAALANVGVYPEWVQIGNETNTGMLWPDGSSAHYDKWAALINKAYNAIKTVSPASKTIIKLSSGPNKNLYKDVFDRLQKAGAKFDVVGMSYYPYWDGVDYTKNINELGENLNDVAARYGKEVMICEVGGFENNPKNTYDILKAAIDKVKAVPNGKGIGVFYWEPEANSSVLPDKYPLGATEKVSTKVLKFTSALDAFK